MLKKKEVIGTSLQISKKKTSNEQPLNNVTLCVECAKISALIQNMCLFDKQNN